MSVVLRLARAGAKKMPYYHIVAADKRSPRDGKFIEAIGAYDPNLEPPKFEVNEERWAVSYSETGMLRLLWSLDLSHRKTRPRHPQSDEKAQQAFKKGGLLLA